VPRDDRPAQAWVYRIELREIVGPFKTAKEATTWAGENTKPGEWLRYFLAKDRASAPPARCRGGVTGSNLPPASPS
jgi:hypothetical protein